MATRRGTGGRPSKGERELLATRPPKQLAEVVRDAAEAAELSISDYIANVLAQAHNLPPVAPPKANANQLKMTA